METERRVSIPSLRELAKACAARGNHPLATTIQDAANELVQLRSEIIKLKGTIHEIRSIANLSIMRRL